MLAAGCRAPEAEREETRAAVEAIVELDAETDATRAGAQPPGPPLVVDVEDEEALGPFASWTNVKTFGAKGDGTTDDTAALQAAIKSLCVYGKTGGPGQPTCNHDLYFPAGTYLITSTLSMSLNVGAGLVGQSPATTTIKWGGAANGIMLRTTSSSDTLFTRLTWDGSGTAGIGVAQWYDTAIPHYQSGIKHVDEVFEDLAFGIYGGREGTNYGNGDSEVTIRRTKFLRASKAGVNVGSFNALDYWIWDSQFTDCAMGATNFYSLTGNWYSPNNSGATPGAGNFMVYRSLFQRSTVADVAIGNTGWFSLHNNVSIGSNQFLYASPVGDNSAGIVVESNRIVDTINPTAIQIGNTGPLVLIDNQIRSATNNEATTKPVVLLDDFDLAYDRNVFSLGNSFTASPTIAVNNPAGSANRALAIGDAVVARSQISGALPTLPLTAVNHSRKVFDVPVSATADDIQAAIDAAAAWDAAGGDDSNPVVHIPGGNYVLLAPLVIPKQARMQLTGDGLGATVLEWGVAGSAGPMIVLDGPSYATVRDLTLTASQATGISINNADQTGGRIFADGVDFVDPVTLSGLSQTRVEFQTSGLCGLTASGSMSVISVGGTIGDGVIDVVNGSRVLLSDHWFEGNSSHLFRGTSGDFTYVGGQISPYSHVPIEAGQPLTSPSVLLDGFAGNVTFVIPGFDLKTGAATAANGVRMVNSTSETSALFLGVGSNISDDFFSGGAGAGSLGIVLSKETDAQGNSIDVPDRGHTDSTFISSGLAQLRGVSWQRNPYARTPGATDVHLLRVSINTAINGQAVGLKATQ